MAAATGEEVVQVKEGGSRGTLRLDLGPEMGSGWVILDDEQESSAGGWRVARVSIFGPSAAVS